MPTVVLEKPGMMGIMAGKAVALRNFLRLNDVMFLIFKEVFKRRNPKVAALSLARGFPLLIF